MLEEKNEFQGPWWQYPPLRNALLAGLISLIAFIFEQTHIITEATAIWMYWISIPLGGYIWAKEGVEELAQEYQVGVSMLMLWATVGAGYLGMWDEAAALVVLYGAAEGIEEYTYSRTRNAIRALLDLAPKQARVIKDSKEELVPVESLKIGDIFIILPGESIPNDGDIIEGKTSIDESTVTGESVPVDKQVGDKVFAATLNGEAAITVKATKVFADNTLSRIIDLVENAQSQKGRAQEWMERFGDKYSPLVLLSALILVLLPLFFDLDSAYWTEKAVILLVAAAPCALIISLPIAMSAGISGAGKRGILVKGGAHLEHLGIIKNIAFDKTGTLTYGKPVVTDVVTFQGNELDFISMAAGLENYSAHPLAKAIVNYANKQKIEAQEVKNTRVLLGSGTRGDSGEETWYLGSPELFSEMGFDLEGKMSSINAFQSEGKTVVLLGTAEQIVGMIALQDIIRKNAAHTIQKLHDMGIKTVMLTGDNLHTAKRIASDLGIDDVRASLKPDDKVSAIKELMKDAPTLMVGDGINDAPALAQATCGVAMGAAGTDAAIEAADIALMADDFGKLEEAIEIGRKARKVSRQNIVFALIVLAILIPAGVGGFITVTIAVLVHEASELLAVANGLRAGSLSLRKPLY
ncbi:MAG: cation-translocating P-type ATPase [Thiovulaceae bacterium]|nr:cation-translocating P-type ATPase [Sulfurimonadaceae bacterium]